jgi:hypothetical protein
MDPHLKKRVRKEEAGGGGRGERRRRRRRARMEERRQTDREKDNSWRCWEAEMETARSWQKN